MSRSKDGEINSIWAYWNSDKRYNPEIEPAIEVQASDKKEVQRVKKPAGFYMDIWREIARSLDRTSISQLRQVCYCLSVDKVIEQERINAWFRELRQEIKGDGADQAKIVLEHARSNRDNTNYLLELNERLAMCTPNDHPNEESGDELTQCIDQLNSITFQDNMNNNKMLINSSIKFMVANSNHLQLCSTKFINHDKNVNRILRYTAHSSISFAAILCLTHLWHFKQPCMSSLTFFGLQSVGLTLWGLHNQRFIDSRRNVKFWKKIDQLPDQNKSELPVLSGLSRLSPTFMVGLCLLMGMVGALVLTMGTSGIKAVYTIFDLCAEIGLYNCDWEQLHELADAKNITAWLPNKP